jgi:hypothetical protein
MMDLIKTARGQVYSCTCGKTIPYRKKDNMVVAEIDARDAALDSDEARKHRRRLRRARAEFLHRNRGFWEKVDDFIIFILLAALLGWAASTACLVWLWPVAIAQVVLGLATMFIAERCAPADETLIEVPTNRGMMVGGGLVGGLAAGLAGQQESTTGTTKLFGMMRDPIGCWKEILLFLTGGGMVFTGIAGGIIWIVLTAS